MWIFFNQPYPALKSRKTLINLLEETGIISVFDKNSSFDRLFPNQDFHSGKGLGNLIALPLHQEAWQKGNGCFIDEEMKPYPDQWKFLSSIQKVTTTHLDKIYASIQSNNDQNPSKNYSDKLILTLNNKVRINRTALNLKLTSFLKEELNFSNSEYFIKKTAGRNTWGTERYFRFIEETEHEVIIPRGFIGKLIRYCRKQNIDFEFQDERQKKELFGTN